MTSGPQPAVAGMGLRQPHYATFLATRPDVGFIEVHTENFFNPYDAAAQILTQVRRDYPVSLHGVGLALGSACGLDDEHLRRLADLVGRIDPVRVSDHAAFARAPWPGRGVIHACDLLPVAFTKASMEVFCAHVQRVQDRLRRPILVENLSSYLDFSECDFSEPAFFAELARRSGCGLLLDVNNVMVNALNAAATDPLCAVCQWLNTLAQAAPAGFVGEIHLAGHSYQQGLVIDDHADVVSPPVWAAFIHALRLFGPVPTLIEWDTHLPALPVLLGEVAHAQRLLDGAPLGAAHADLSCTPADVRPPMVDRVSGKGAPFMAARARYEREAQRQRLLVEAIFAPPSPTPPAPAIGLSPQKHPGAVEIAAYRRNGLAHATAALQIQYPTVLAMLGEEAFAAVCARYWRRCPPIVGDLAQVGEEFPEGLAAEPELVPWPWLADSARLDRALWQVIWAAPANPQPADLSRLATIDPVFLRLRLAEGTRLVSSRWPIVTLWNLHRAPVPDIPALQAALQQPGETGWVWREGMQAQCTCVAAAEAQWLQALQDSSTLAAALVAAPEEFDVAVWLHEAVKRRWMATVDCIDPVATETSNLIYEERSP